LDEEEIRRTPLPGRVAREIAVLKLNNIEVLYRNVIQVLRGVSLEVTEGQVVTILGGNGAGKTTTLKAVSGLLRTEEGEVSHGSIEFQGTRIDRKSPEEIARMGIIQILEGRRVLEHLTVEENLMGGSLIRKDRSKVKQDLEKVYGYFPQLRHLKGSTSGYLSGGEQQMMVTGRALMSSPKLMLLDEPSMGLSPLLVKEIFGIIARINLEEKLPILLVEQNVKIALNVAHYGYVMENGRIVLDGSVEQLRENEDIKEFYLGFSAIGERKSYRAVKHYRRRKRWIG
jgi:branched-chain amino acid transport system ATP-binding protein